MWEREDFIKRFKGPKSPLLAICCKGLFSHIAGQFPGPAETVSRKSNESWECQIWLVTPHYPVNFIFIQSIFRALLSAAEEQNLDPPFPPSLEAFWWGLAGEAPNGRDIGLTPLGPVGVDAGDLQHEHRSRREVLVRGVGVRSCHLLPPLQACSASQKQPNSPVDQSLLERWC